jgi:hypothetical protein
LSSDFDQALHGNSANFLFLVLEGFKKFAHYEVTLLLDFKILRCKRERHEESTDSQQRSFLQNFI